MRLISEIEADLDANRDAMKKLQESKRLLKVELDEAKDAAAKAAPHPWLGKNVKRTFMHCRKERTERGTVVLYDRRQHLGIRNHRPEAGEHFVLSASGLTGYSMNGRHHAEWELDQ